VIRNVTGSADIFVTFSFSTACLTGMGHLSKGDKTSAVTTAESNFKFSDSKVKLIN